MYFDTAYLAKLYIAEEGSDAVRNRAANAEHLFCSAHGRVELAFMFHRKLRERSIRRRHFEEIWRQVDADETEGLLHWLPLTPAILDAAANAARDLPASCFLRSSDALHLACARENGFREIFSNDTHLLAAAKHFGISGKNVIR